MLKPKVPLPPSKVVSSQTKPIAIKRPLAASLPSDALSSSPDMRSAAEFSDLVGSPPSDKPKIKSKD